MNLVQKAVGFVGIGVLSLSLLTGMASAEESSVTLVCNAPASATVAGDLEFADVNVAESNGSRTSDGAITITANVPCGGAWKVTPNWSDLSNGSSVIPKNNLILEGYGPVVLTQSTFLPPIASPWMGRDTASMGHLQTLNTGNFHGTAVANYTGVLTNIPVVATGTYTGTITVTLAQGS